MTQRDVVADQVAHLAFVFRPVIIDPSHSRGRRDLVLPLSKAGIVDVHPDPGTALCDDAQTLVREDLDQLAQAVAELTVHTGRRPGRRPGRQLIRVR